MIVRNRVIRRGGNHQNKHGLHGVECTSCNIERKQYGLISLTTSLSSHTWLGTSLSTYCTVNFLSSCPAIFNTPFNILINTKFSVQLHNESSWSPSKVDMTCHRYKVFQPAFPFIPQTNVYANQLLYVITLQHACHHWHHSPQQYCPSQVKSSMWWPFIECDNAITKDNIFEPASPFTLQNKSDEYPCHWRESGAYQAQTQAQAGSGN